MDIEPRNPLPVFRPIDDRFVPLPAHLMDVATHRCVYCNQEPLWDSYEAYVEHWLANEYEGEPGHTHDTREEFEWLNGTCLEVEEGPVMATPENIYEGGWWFGEKITRVEDANAYGHYPGRKRITVLGMAFHVTYGATYSGPLVAIV